MPPKFQIYVDQSMRQVETSQPILINNPPCQQPQQAHQQIQQYQQYQHQHVNPPTTQGEQQQAAPVKEHNWPRYIKENLDPQKQMFFFDEHKIYPTNGGEFSFEELNLMGWMKRQSELALRRRCEELEVEVEDLKQELEMARHQVTTLANTLTQLQEQQRYQAQEHLNEHNQQRDQHFQQQEEQHQLHAFQLQQQHVLQQQPTQTLTATMTLKPGQSPPNNRLSIVPQSLQPAHCNDADTSCYGQLNEAPSVVQDLWKQSDKFTVPIDQSQYIREHCPTSTPTSKDDKAKKTIRRMSRPSIGGSPTMKLSPITETSRDCNSKSSSSSSAISTTPGTTCKRALQLEPLPPLVFDEPDRPLDPNDPTTYRGLLRMLSEPLERRSGYLRFQKSMPAIKDGATIGDGRYLVGNEVSKEAKIYSGVLLDVPEDSNEEMLIKNLCFRVDQPSNDWLFYICDELHKRLIRQKTQPDIELSIMSADPAIIYLDGSILVDESFGFVPLEEYLNVCAHFNKPFPRSFAAYLTLELIQLVRGIHSCDIVHMNLNPLNIIITGCPKRDDITSVGERTSVIKLLGFERSIDTRLIPNDFKFSGKPDYVNVDSVLESRWLHEIDWILVLNCIHRMFFLEDMKPVRQGDKWNVNKQFKGFPTDVWDSIFDSLLNIKDMQETNALVERAVDELSTWVKANVSFVLRESLRFDMLREDFCNAACKSIGA